MRMQANMSAEQTCVIRERAMNHTCRNGTVVQLGLQASVH